MDAVHCTQIGSIKVGDTGTLIRHADPDWTALGIEHSPNVASRVRLTDWSGPETRGRCRIDVWAAAMYTSDLVRYTDKLTYRWLAHRADLWVSEPWDEAVASCPATGWGNIFEIEVLNEHLRRPSAAATCAAAYARPSGVGLVIPDGPTSRASLWVTRCDGGVLHGGVRAGIDDLGGVLLGTGRLGTPGGAVLEVPAEGERCGDWTRSAGELVTHLAPLERVPDWTAWLATDAGPVLYRAPPTDRRCGLRPGEVVDWTRDPPAPELERCLRDAAGLTAGQRVLTLRAPG